MTKVDPKAKVALLCGQSSYPRQDSATANRYRAIAEITSNLGYRVVFINRHPNGLDAGHELRSEQFEAINVSGSIRKPSWLRRQAARLVAQPKELYQIVAYGKQHQVDVVHVYTQFSFDLLLYKVASRLIRAKPVLHLVEYRSKIDGRSALFRFNDLVYDALAARLFTRFITISSLIATRTLSLNSRAKVALVPPICDFDMIDRMETAKTERPYFVYCASMAYEEVAIFVIEAFLRLQSENCDLLLVLSGMPSGQVLQACERSKSIRIVSQLSYADLLARYKGALALLIPLRENLQDAARYPQKMSEYVASRRPIITCAVGDVARDFKHLQTALIAQHYDVSEFASLMSFALSSPRQLEEIAHAGYVRGKELFDVRSQASHVKAIVYD